MQCLSHSSSLLSPHIPPHPMTFGTVLDCPLADRTQLCMSRPRRLADAGNVSRREGGTQGWQRVCPGAQGQGWGQPHGRVGGCSLCQAGWPARLGTELSLSEHRMQLGLGRMEHMAREFGRMPGNEAGLGRGEWRALEFPGKAPRRSGAGQEGPREQLDPDGFPIWLCRNDSPLYTFSQ